MGEFKGCQVKFKLDVKNHPCQKFITYGRLDVFFHIKNQLINVKNQPFIVG